MCLELHWTNILLPLVNGYWSSQLSSQGRMLYHWTLEPTRNSLHNVTIIEKCEKWVWKQIKTDFDHITQLYCQALREPRNLKKKQFGFYGLKFCLFVVPEPWYCSPIQNASGRWALCPTHRGLSWEDSGRDKRHTPCDTCVSGVGARVAGAGAVPVTACCGGGGRAGAPRTLASPHSR